MRLSASDCLPHQVRLTPEDKAEALAAVAQPLPGNANYTVWNPFVIRTTRGIYAVQCTNPYVMASDGTDGI